MENLVTKWDVTDRVFQFGSVDVCLTIEEYSRILGVPTKSSSSSLRHLTKVSRFELLRPSEIRRVS